MRTLQVLHANRLAVLLGSGLLCLLGILAGCDSGSGTAMLDPEANKAREEAEAKARQAAFGKAGIPAKTAKGTPKK